jgi:flagellar hook-associated protein 3
MSLRPTQAATFNQVRRGLSLNFTKLVRAQEQVATGKRILRPSDDAVGTSISLALRRQSANVVAFRRTIEASRPSLEGASSELQNASNLATEARALLLQGMNGTLSQADRDAMASQVEQLRDSMIDIGNARSGDRFLFGGTATDREPFVRTQLGDSVSIAYRGNSDTQNVLVGRNIEMGINTPGDQIFGRQQFSGTSIGSLTGLTLGPTANSGSGFEEITIRHTSTTGALGSGLAFVSNGALDTVMGNHDLNVDATANTVRLGSGVPIQIPDPTDPDVADFVVTGEDGATLHLDFSGYTNTGSSTVVTGNGAITIDQQNYTPLTFTETDLELVDAQTGAVVHVDTTQLSRSGRELVNFEGTANIFNTLTGIVTDLRNVDDLEASAVRERLNQRMSELDRNSENIRIELGSLGARTDRMNTTAARLADLDLHTQGLISQVEDADLSSVVLDLTRAEQTLQAAQATGARLIQQSLLNFLR